MLGGLAPTQLSGAAQSELMDLCEQQFAQLEKVKAEWKPKLRGGANLDFLCVAASE